GEFLPSDVAVLHDQPGPPLARHRRHHEVDGDDEAEGTDHHGDHVAPGELSGGHASVLHDAHSGASKLATYWSASAFSLSSTRKEKLCFLPATLSIGWRT